MSRKRSHAIDDDEWEGFDDDPPVGSDAEADSTIDDDEPAHVDEPGAFSDDEDDVGIPIFPAGLIAGGQLSTQELKDALNAHGKEHGYAVTLRNGKKDRSGEQISRWYVYCVRYGAPALTDAAGLRQGTTKKTGCNFRASVNLTPEGWVLRHLKPENRVHNHPASLDAAAYHQHRRISPEIRAKIESLSAYTALRAREILAIVKGEDDACDLTVKDVNNLRQEIRRKELDGCMPAGAILKAFDDAGINYIAKYNPDNVDQLCGLFFTFKTCEELWKRFPDCLSLDNTYKTNSLGFPLFVVTTQTNVNSIANVAFGLVDNERREGFDFLAQALDELRVKVGARRPAVTITDRDHQMRGALQAVFPEAQQLLCRFHIAQNVLLNAKTKGKWKKADLEAEEQTRGQTRGRPQGQAGEADEEQSLREV
jgi:hypothetical protein